MTEQSPDKKPTSWKGLPIRRQGRQILYWVSYASFIFGLTYTLIYQLQLTHIVGSYPPAIVTIIGIYYRDYFKPTAVLRKEVGPQLIYVYVITFIGFAISIRLLLLWSNYLPPTTLFVLGGTSFFLPVYSIDTVLKWKQGHASDLRITANGTIIAVILIGSILIFPMTIHSTPDVPNRPSTPFAQAEGSWTITVDYTETTNKSTNKMEGIFTYNKKETIYYSDYTITTNETTKSYEIWSDERTYILTNEPKSDLPTPDNSYSVEDSQKTVYVYNIPAQEFVDRFKSQRYQKPPEDKHIMPTPILQNTETIPQMKWNEKDPIPQPEEGLQIESYGNQYDVKGTVSYTSSLEDGYVSNYEAEWKTKPAGTYPLWKYKQLDYNGQYTIHIQSYDEHKVPQTPKWISNNS